MELVQAQNNVELCLTFADMDNSVYKHVQIQIDLINRT